MENMSDNNNNAKNYNPIQCIQIFIIIYLLYYLF